MERQINLASMFMPACKRIAFILPREGNVTEYMAINQGQLGFDGLLKKATQTVEHILDERAVQQKATDRTNRYQRFLELLAEFGPNGHL